MLGIVTIVRGRHEHLRRQLLWINALATPPHVHIVVAMGDGGVADVVNKHGNQRTVTLNLPDTGELQLARARNVGVAEARLRGCDQVALLDVDCLPVPSFVSDYERQLAAVEGIAVVTGRVQYLPEGLSEGDYAPSSLERLRAIGRDHGARPVPPGDELVPADVSLLWSLNIALSVANWDEIGGFDERYVGYGGEDTDFGQRLCAAGGTLWVTGLAGALHQWHTSNVPPVQHAAAIVRNANLYHSIWGSFPMEGWLREMADMGLVEFRQGAWSVI